MTELDRLLGEQIQALSIGPAGQRNSSDAIGAIAGISGHVCFGPYRNLPPGLYSVRMIFFADTLPANSAEDVEIVLEVSVGADIVAAMTLDETSVDAGVVALPFRVVENGDNGQPAAIETRVHSTGKLPFTITSMDLRRLNSTAPPLL